MSITDELREYANTRISPNKGMLTAIADRIDAEHEAMLADARKAVYQDYVALPKDANGEYIHVGDVMEHNGVRANVLGITFHGTTPPTVCIVRGDCWVEANECRHYHAPTVEDVLCDLLNEYRENECTLEEARLSEYATRLRLAEGEDA